MRFKDSFFIRTHKRFSIRSKLISAFAAVSLVPVLILGIYLLAGRINQTEENAQRYIDDKLRIGALMWEVQKQVLENQTRTIALDNFVILNRDLGLDQPLSGYLQGVIDRYALGMALILDPDGKILASAGVSSDTSLIEQVFASFLIQEPQQSRPHIVYLPADNSNVDVPAMLSVHPVYNYSRRLTGYAVCVVILNYDAASPEHLFFDELNLWIQEPFFIQNTDSVFYSNLLDIASSGHVFNFEQPGSPGRKSYSQMTYENARYMVSSVVLEKLNGRDSVRLAVAYPSVYHERQLIISVTVVICIITGSLALALLVGFFLSENLSAPLVRIAQGARSIGEGDYSVRLPVISDDEVGQMAQEFNKMTSKLSRTMENLAREAEEHLAAEQQVRVLNEELEVRIADRTRELAEKNLLLKEVHHRVKNNMQVISSLLYLQQSSCSDPVVCNALSVAESRIYSMSLVHNCLYKSEDFTSIDLKDLFSQMLSSEGPRTLGVWSVQGETVLLPLDRAVPCALAVHELALNAVKHAEADVKGGNLVLSENEGVISILIEDYGPGFTSVPSDTRAPGIGLTLVQDLMRQLGGTVQIENRSTGGAAVKILFPSHL